MWIKIIFLVFSLNFFVCCNCENELSKFSNLKSPFEAEFNREAVENLKKKFGIDEETVRRGSRIAGGSNAVLGQFPYQAFVVMNSTYACGGTLISYNTVLTAAHCIFGFIKFQIFLGIINQEIGPYEYYSGELNLSYTRYHPQYNPNNFNNDIGLFILPNTDQNLLNNRYIDICNLPTLSEHSIDLTGKIATVSGFGKVNDTSTGSPTLRYVDVPIMSNARCQSVFGSDTVRDTNICIDTTGGRSSCQGDSGGPLTADIVQNRRVIVGIVSFGAEAGCTLNYPAGYARVSSYLNWINQYVPSTTPAPTTTPGSTTPKGGAASLSGFFSALIFGLILLLNF